MEHTSDEKLEEQLNNLQPSPSVRFYRRMARAAWTSAAITWRRAYVVTGVMLLLAITLLAFTPQGRAWAQSILGFFTSTEKKTLPLPLTPGPVPTYYIKPALQPIQQTPATDPVRCGPTISPVTSTFMCQLINAQAQAGFKIRVFGSTEIPLEFNYIWVDSSRVTIAYSNEKYPEHYIFRQGQGNFPADTPPWDVVSADAIQKAQVGIYPAEFVGGAFMRYRNGPSVDWSTSKFEARLRWREGERWYSITALIASYDEGGDDQWIRDRLVEFGEGLTTLEPGSQSLAGGADTSLEQRLGFHILVPASQPEGYSLYLVEYGDKLSILPGAVSMDYNFIDRSESVGGMWLSETSVSNSKLDFVQYFSTSLSATGAELVTDKLVQIGTIRGRYMVREDGAALVWEQGGVKLMLEAFWYPGYGGRLSRDELITIAESMK